MWAFFDIGRYVPRFGKRKGIVEKMSFETAIQAEMEKAKRQAIIDRVLTWIERADTVDIVRESPGMKRKSSSMLDGMEPTGDLTIELKLTGINMSANGIVIRLKSDGNRHAEDDYVFE